MREWGETFRAWGWTACRSTRPDEMHVGVAHPRYGVMPLRVLSTAATSLTVLAKFARPADVPTLFVGATLLTDAVRGGAHTAVGVLAFSRGVVPLFLVKWNSQWLPYFEDDNDWVHTGWTADGRVVPEFKPEGWDGALLGGETEGAGSTGASRASFTL